MFVFLFAVLFSYGEPYCLRQFYSPMAIFTAICKYNLSKCRLKLLKIAEKALALGGDFLINFVKEIRLGLAA